jgi:hypothetical protein
MANINKWIAGAQSTWASAGFTAADFNSLGNGSVAVATTTIDNSTNNDMFLDVSFAVKNGGTATTSTSTFALYLLPLNQDATSYGDGTTTGSTAPSASYWKTSCGVSGASNATLNGTFPRIQIPNAKFRLAIVNNAGAALNATASATVQYQTFNIQNNG